MSQRLQRVLMRSLILGTGLLLAAYGGACAFLFLRQNHLVYTPTALVQKPAVTELPYQEVWLPSPGPTDPKSLYGWWIPAAAQSRGVVLYFHGAGHNLNSYKGDLQALHRRGFSVFAIDYRGYGLSQGSFPSEAQLYEDARSAWSYLTQQRQIPPKQIYIFGVSLGGAVAIELARQQPDAAALIVVSSFTSMQDQISSLGFGIFPLDLLLTQRFESLQKLPAVRVPLLLAHGSADRYVPPWMGQKLYDAAAQPKRLLLFPGIDHGQIGTLITSPEFGAALQQLTVSTTQN
jgi:uncharacterized protein